MKRLIQLGLGLFLVSAFLMPITAMAETTPATAPTTPAAGGAKRKTKMLRVKKLRQLASEEDANPYMEFRARGSKPLDAAREDHDWNLRLGGLAGLTAMSSSTVNPGFTNVGLGFTGDFRGWKYFGADLDVHHDVLMGHYDSSGTGQGPNLSRKLSGALFNLKTMYPFWLKSIKVTPKGGLGFGTNSLDETSKSSSGVTDTATTTITAPYWILGFDVEPTPDIVLYIDYLHSFAESGSLSIQSGQSEALTAPVYDRFRLGGYYRFAPSWGVGGQILRRSTGYYGQTVQSLSTSTSGASGSQADAQWQVMGMLVLELF